MLLKETVSVGLTASPSGVFRNIKKMCTKMIPKNSIKLSTLLSFMYLVVLSTGCMDDTASQQEDGTLLSIEAATIKVDATQTANTTSVNSASAAFVSKAGTKASLRSATALSTDDHIGIFLSGSGYTSRTNVDYSYVSATSWTSSNPIYLYSSQASVCAYYPYRASTTDVTAVPLTSQLYSEAADLYYCPNQTVSSTSPGVTFAMTHAYAKMTFNITRDASYEGVGSISKIMIENADLVDSNTLNISTSTYGIPSESGLVSVSPGSVTLPASGSSTVEVLMVPTITTLTGNVVFSFVVDGETIVAALPASTNNLSSLAAANNYVVTATIKGQSLVITHVAVTDWTDVSSGTIHAVTMAEEANCYMVPLGETVYIPVSRVTKAWTEINGSSYTLPTDWTASLLWTTSSNGVSASGSVADVSYNTDGGYIKVTAGCVEGNSVIAIYDGSTILWSWHIWTTNYNPDGPTNGTTYNFNTNNPLTFMDRNLGATGTTANTTGVMGLFYQWGRKDPFPGASTAYYATNGEYNSLPIYNVSGTQLTEGSQTGGTGINSVAASATTTDTKTLNLTNAIKNPMTFYYATSVGTYIGYDWYTTTDDENRTYQNDALWGGASTLTPTSKTIFDPCPAGWRVPPWQGVETPTTSECSPWGSFGLDTTEIKTSVTVAVSGGTWSSYGITWTSAGFYPAAGYRNASSGALSSVGGYGAYWSASTYNGTGFRLVFTSSGVYPAFYSFRAGGISVRCVQEF
jgi:hypothetical protein